MDEWQVEMKKPVRDRLFDSAGVSE